MGNKKEILILDEYATKDNSSMKNSKVDESIYWSPQRLLSRDAIISMSLGGRGIGKSFSTKKMLIDNFLDKGEQGMYVRRTEAELDEVKNVLMDDMKEHYPEHEFKTCGYAIFIDGELAIYLVALSKVGNKKSAPFPKVTLIVFDEYIIEENGHSRYIKNEVQHLLSLMETVFRFRKPRVFICSNNVSYVNPLFDTFKIEPKGNEEFIQIKGKNRMLITVELVKAEKYAQVKGETDFAELQELAGLKDYMINNKVLVDTNDYILPKRPQGFDSFLCAFRKGSHIIGVWNNGRVKDCPIYFTEMYDKNSDYKYTLYSNENYEGWRSIKVDRGRQFPLGIIKKQYYGSNMYYENQSVKKFVQDTVIRFI